MGNIVLLDELTINKIAAGEVIERPASVVKELMENSIDAGATSVTAEIKNGGITYIRITDNGKGFLPDDMEIAFERHATSKIRSAKDLETVKSMGFRGEALASIAAIAHVELTSRTADSQMGYKIVVEGGKILNKEVVGCPKGTTIVVENLFYNTPVRYKFLKKDFTELGYVEDAVSRLALVNPGVAVKLISLGKAIIQTTGNGNLKDSVYSIFGKEVAENIINVDYELEGMSIKGCIGKPEVAKSNRSSQLFFVNGRYVKDKTLSSATEQAFRGMLPAGKYGFLILNLSIDPHQIDVNVHPAKLEIRFQEENKIFKLVYHAIKEAFIQNENEQNKEKQAKEDDILELIKEGYNTKFDQKELEKQREFIYSTPKEEEKEEEKENEKYEQKDNLIEDIYNDKIKEQIQNNTDNNENNLDEKVESNVDFNQNIIDKEIDEYINMSEKEEQKADSTGNLNEENNENKEEITTDSSDISNELDSTFEEMYRKTFGKPPVENKVEEHSVSYETNVNLESAENVSAIGGRSVLNKVNYKYIGLAFSTYIVIEIGKELYIIDQQAANERIIYEDIKARYYSKSEKESQMMLLPDIIDLSTKQMDITRDNEVLLRKAGFDFEEFGENTVKLIGVPNICIDLDTRELFIEIIDEINTVARTAKQEIEDKFIATIARKVAKKTKNALTFEEVDELMQKLLVLDNPFVGPNKNVNAIKLSETEIEKKFSK